MSIKYEHELTRRERRVLLDITASDDSVDGPTVLVSFPSRGMLEQRTEELTPTEARMLGLMLRDAADAAEQAEKARIEAETAESEVDDDAT